MTRKEENKKGRYEEFCFKITILTQNLPLYKYVCTFSFFHLLIDSQENGIFKKTTLKVVEQMTFNI